jgi:chromate reductase, NAD(P)H dehydrogenase (quinone)
MKARNVVAFGASYSRHSINKEFASFVANFIPNGLVTVVDLSEFDVPIYTPHEEEDYGIPEKVKVFDQLIQEADILVISLAEHNGSYTAAFKNLFDWWTRLRPKCVDGKNLIFTSTAPGPRGGMSVLEAAESRFPRHGGILLGTFSLPQFDENFDKKRGIIQPDLKVKFDLWIEEVIKKLG